LGQVALINRANEQLQELCRTSADVYAIDYARLVARAGVERWYDDRLRYYARAPIAASMLGELAREYVKYLRALTGQTKKCLVLDLDNTLWGGILGELGPNGVALGSDYPGNAFLAFQHAILELRRRGTILAIASKNNPADVEELFEKNESMVLKKEHFSAIEVGWADKASALSRIAATLNIGLEHIVFVDDNPAECALVEQIVPAVRVICLPDQPERYIDALLRDGLFDGLSLSAEDLERGDLYARRDQAEAARRRSSSLEDFYRDLAMTVTLAPVTPATLPRAAQMTQKTNQFNVTTLRFGEAQLAARLKDANWWLTTIDVKDRFGNHGITGLLMSRLHQDHVEIETFLLSCRVIGRTVETAALARLARRAHMLGLKQVKGRIVPTSKNMPVRDLYERHGFRRDPEDETVWWLGIDGAVPRDPEWLNIVEKEAS
jgi:FkbH-like protein